MPASRLNPFYVKDTAHLPPRAVALLDPVYRMQHLPECKEKEKKSDLSFGVMLFRT